jgi:taurine dioxygenase
MSSHINVVESQIDVRPVAGRIGAEIAGVKLTPDLSKDAVAAIYAALLKHKAIFFRSQNHLDDASQEAVAGLFGTPEPHPTVGATAGQYILELDGSHSGGRATVWHTDITFIDAYPKLSVLRSVVSPESGGDTVWANTAAAYQDLPAELKTLADSLWATHSNLYDYGGIRPDATQAAAKRYLDVFVSTLYETDHPVVRVHPETGERTLVLGNFLRRLKGYPSDVSSQLVAVLQSYVTRLENTVRWRWQTGDVVIWDNRATQHIAINDYGDQPRVVRRVSVRGEAPVSIDGRSSETRILSKAA